MIDLLRKTLAGTICLLGLLFSLAPSPAAAADYPNRPVRWLIDFAAGGPVDIAISDKAQLIFDNLPSALKQARGGSVRALGAASPKRWPTAPDIPAIAETVPGFESVGFYGTSSPKGTPPENVEILNKAVSEALKDPKLVARLAEVGKLVTDETEK
jgi:tripartite-type tricarboxylate transporter receptor subunit TctC